jgi:predicted RNase H-like HicB family nuclease
MRLASVCQCQAGIALTIGAMSQVKIIVEKHTDGYVAYPVGLRGVVVGEGETYDEALSDVKSAIRFHIDTFGNDVLESESPIQEAFITEADLSR